MIIIINLSTFYLFCLALVNEIDILQRVQLSVELTGVKPANGPAVGQTAFKLKPSKRDISAGTVQTEPLVAALRRSSGFVMSATVLQDPKNRGTIVSFDKSKNERAFALHLSRRENAAILQYMVNDGSYSYETEVRFEDLHADPNSRVWHTYVLEVNGNLAQLYVDCELRGLQLLESTFYADMDPEQPWDLRVGKGILGRTGIADFRVS